MAKLILVLLILVGCATSNRERKEVLNRDMQSKLFKLQEILEAYKNSNDQLLSSLPIDSCLLKWEANVKMFRKQLAAEFDIKKKATFWLRLGHCYNYVGLENKSLYYYDLALSSGAISGFQKSTISYNMGRAFVQKGLDVLAESYFSEALRLDSQNILAIIEKSLIYTKQGSYQESLRLLNSLVKRFPKSNFVRFLVGINYYGLGDTESLQGKVIPLINDKREEALLLSIARDSLVRNQKQEELFDRLGSIETSLPLYRSFKDLLSQRIGGSLDDKK